MGSLPFTTGLFGIQPEMCVDQYLSMIGIEYEVSWIDIAVTAGEKVYLKWVSSPDKYTVTNFRQIIMDQERGFYRVFTEFTGGTPGAAIPIKKTRTDSSIDPGLSVTLLSAPGTINQDSLGVQEPLFGQPGQGVIQATGGATTDQALRITPPGTEFISEFENASVAACYLQVNIHWWEISEKALPLIKAL